MDVGPITTGVDVQYAVIDHLANWLPTYLEEMNRIHELTMPHPGTILPGGDTIDALKQNRLPAVVVMTPIMAGVPVKAGLTFTCRWAVGIGCVVAARDRDSTNRMAGYYIAAVRACIVQHPSLGGFASAVNWEDEGSGELDYSDSETVSAGRLVFIVTVENAMRAFGGPAEPTTDPFPATLTITEVSTTIVKKELTDAL